MRSESFVTELWRLEGTLEVSSPTHSGLSYTIVHLALSSAICGWNTLVDPRIDLLPHLVWGCRWDWSLSPTWHCCGHCLCWGHPVDTMEQPRFCYALLPSDIYEEVTEKRKLLLRAANSRRVRGNGHRLEKEILSLRIRKKLFLMKAAQQCSRGPERLCRLHP